MRPYRLYFWSSETDQTSVQDPCHSPGEAGRIIGFGGIKRELRRMVVWMHSTVQYSTVQALQTNDWSLIEEASAGSLTSMKYDYRRTIVDGCTVTVVDK
jgi:hypothetical protein